MLNSLKIIFESKHAKTTDEKPTIGIRSSNKINLFMQIL